MGYLDSHTVIASSSVGDIHRRRPTLVLAAFVLLIGAAIVLIQGRGDQYAWRSYAANDFPLAVEYPGSWSSQPFNEHSPHPFYGVLISNAGLKLAHPDLGSDRWTSAWDMRQLPSSAIVVQVSITPGLGKPTKVSTDFPVSLKDARQFDETASYGAPQPRMWIPLKVAGGYEHQISVWIGEDASGMDRALAERIVESVNLRQAR